MPSIAKSGSELRLRMRTVAFHIIKAILLSVSIIWFLIKVSESYGKLKSEEIGTEVKVVNNLEVDPPGLTICKPYHIAYDSQKLAKYGLKNGDDQTYEGLVKADEMNRSLRSILEESFYSHEDLIFDVEFMDQVDFEESGYSSGFNSISTNEEEFASRISWHPVQSTFNGLCQSLIVKKEGLKTLRSNLALIKLTFFAEKHEVGIPSWMIYIHSPFGFGHGQEVLKTIQQVSTRDSKCNDDPGYKLEVCLAECLIKEQEKKFGCLHPKVPRQNTTKLLDCQLKDYQQIYGTSDEGRLYEGLYNMTNELRSDEYQKSVCGCFPPCNLTLTKVGVNARLKDEIKDGAVAVLKFPQTVQTYREYITYSQFDFTSDIGGFLGLFLGVSLYSLHEHIRRALEFCL